MSADTVTPTETPTPPDPETTTAAADTVREAGTGLPPGLLFFLGGLFVLAVLVGVLYLRQSYLADVSEYPTRKLARDALIA